MLTRPEGLADVTVLDAVASGWGLHGIDIEYAPVGFGSFHWWIAADGRRWFVTVDDLETRRRDDGETREDAFARLSAALSTARSLRDAGMDFVVAPMPARSGGVVQRVGDRFAIAVYPRIEGDTHTWGAYETHAERLAVLDLVAVIHGADSTLREHTLTDDLAVPSRGELHRALSELDRPWEAGPFSEPARTLLEAAVGSVKLALIRYDRLAADVRSRPDRMVLTHGEPHRANTITTTAGPVLIDWDTVLIAPAERDLWALAIEDPDVLDAYAARTGVIPEPDALALYTLWWQLTEISLYVAQFRRQHVEDKDTRIAWDGLNESLDAVLW